jgi:hypothetical protein
VIEKVKKKLVLYYHPSATSYTLAVDFFHGSKILVGQGLFFVEVAPSHSVKLLWTDDQPVAEIST